MSVWHGNSILHFGHQFKVWMQGYFCLVVCGTMTVKYHEWHAHVKPCLVERSTMKLMPATTMPTQLIHQLKHFKSPFLCLVPNILIFSYPVK